MDAFVDALYDARVVTAIIAILIPLFVYKYSTRNFDYWKKRGIPFAKPYPFIGSLVEGFKKNLDEMEYDRYFRLGRIYGHFESNKPFITVAEPELIKNILVKDFQYFTNRRIFVTGDPVADKMMTILQGEDWKRVRTIVSPTFSTGKIKRVMSIFQDCARTAIENLKRESENNKPVDVYRVFGGFTMDVIASSAFSTKIDSHNDPENIFVRMAKRGFGGSIGVKLLLFLVIPKVMKFLKFKAFDAESMDFFKNVTLEIIAERRKSGQTRNDFLQLLMDSATELVNEDKLEEAPDDITSNYTDDATNHQIFKGTISKHLSMDELIGQCVIFFLAGYHTTAATLGITTYLLALHQDEQERAFKEMKEVLSETNGVLTYESVQKMKHLDNIISESLRIYSPALRLEREAEVDYPLGDTGITIPKGMTVGVPMYPMHKDPKFFPEPEKFIPDRFTPEGREKIIPYSYLPFGAGPRNCVGMRFALMEIKVCLIYIFSHFHIRLSSESKVPLEFGRGLGLLTPKPIYLNLEPRNDCPLTEQNETA